MYKLKARINKLLLYSRFAFALITFANRCWIRDLIRLCRSMPRILNASSRCCHVANRNDG